jgi:hypothetical protein
MIGGPSLCLALGLYLLYLYGGGKKRKKSTLFTDKDFKNLTFQENNNTVSEITQGGFRNTPTFWFFEGSGIGFHQGKGSGIFQWIRIGFHL